MPAKACSKGTAETPTTPGTPTTAGRSLSGSHQELKYPSDSKNACHRLDGRYNSVASSNSNASNNNSKDDSNIITAHNSRNASNIRNDINNMTANTPLKSEMTAAAWTIEKSGMSSAVGDCQNRQ
jgi:hypothetical protein